MKHLSHGMIRGRWEMEDDQEDGLTKQSVEQIERNNDAEDARNKVIKIARDFGYTHPSVSQPQWSCLRVK